MLENVEKRQHLIYVVISLGCISRINVEFLGFDDEVIATNGGKDSFGRSDQLDRVTFLSRARNVDEQLSGL